MLLRYQTINMPTNVGTLFQVFKSSNMSSGVERPQKKLLEDLLKQKVEVTIEEDEYNASWRQCCAWDRGYHSRGPM